MPELLNRPRPAFAVVSVTRDATPGLIEQVAAAGLPVLTETPPGLDLDDLHRLHALAQQGARIQVAEQYHLQPLVRVQLELARSGPLGDIHYSHCSLAHDYHGVSVLRRALGIGFDDATIRAAREFRSPLTAGPDRTGDPAEERTVTASQVIAELDFGDRLGVYDFSTEHYFSWIRTRELLIRGTRGEIRGDQLRYLQDFRTPIRSTAWRSRGPCTDSPTTPVDAGAPICSP
jgi:predicted dehydrogenase